MKYWQTQHAYLNCERRMFESSNPYNIPELEPVEIDFSDSVVYGFNYATQEKHPEEKIVHFFMHDYQFERVWNTPERYIPILKRFKAVIAPDFSIYTDFPKAVQIFNYYRKQWCGAYWQENGVKVIPCVTWGDKSSFEWCFDGIPRNSMVCINTVGGFGNHSHDSNTAAWLLGYNKAIEVLQPSKLILFGKWYPQIKFDGPVTVVQSSNIANIMMKCAKPRRRKKEEESLWAEEEKSLG